VIAHQIILITTPKIAAANVILKNQIARIQHSQLTTMRLVTANAMLPQVTAQQKLLITTRNIVDALAIKKQKIALQISQHSTLRLAIVSATFLQVIVLQTSHIMIKIPAAVFVWLLNLIARIQHFQLTTEKLVTAYAMSHQATVFPKHLIITQKIAAANATPNLSLALKNIQLSMKRLVIANVM